MKNGPWVSSLGCPKSEIMPDWIEPRRVHVRILRQIIIPVEQAAGAQNSHGFPSPSQETREPSYPLAHWFCKAPGDRIPERDQLLFPSCSFVFQAFDLHLAHSQLG